MSLAVLLLRYSTHLVAPTGRRQNILLITIDTLRWDHLGCYGNTRAATPALDALASRGVRFETAVAHVPLTAPSHASILTGLTPVRHGVRDNGGYALPHGVPTLASRLRASGYRTGAFVSGFPLDRRFGLGAGFDEYDDRLTRTAGRAPYTERRADVTTDHVIGWLDRQEPAPDGGGTSVGPWFIWVHYFDPHAPYIPPEPFAGRFADRPYDGEVAFVDSQIGRLLQHLDTRGEAMRTLVLVTADHGESFSEHGEDTHGVFVYDATLRVPFIIAGPGANIGQASSVLARSIDVVPTLLDLGGLGVPRDVDGRSLRQAIDGGSLADEPAYIESLMAARHLGWSPLQGFRSASWKYIRAPRPELYDLRRDPGERQNRIADHRAQAASFESLLRAQTPSAGASAAATSTGPVADAQLRALGYLSGGVSTTRVSPERDPKDGIRLISTLERGVAEVAMNPAHAVDILETVLREDPSVTLARRHLALAHIALGQHAAAIQQLVWLRREGQATPDDLLALSESKRALGKDAEARALVQEAARLDPRSPEPALTEARAEMAAGRVGEAETAYRRALDIAGEHPEALRGLGEVAMIRGDLETARRFFERAHARDPDDPVGTVRLAVVHARAGEIGAALPLFQRAVQQRPDDPDALAGLGAVLARSGRPAEAVPYFERAIGTGLRTPAVFNGLGFAKLEAGDGAGALMALQTSLQLRPDQPQVADAVRRLLQSDTDGARR
jgi:arylsulfatase A-like enzyme/Tfp pilus assembly protein PilF